MAVKTNNPKMGRPVGNKYLVPKKQWAKWSNTAKRVFNLTYASLRMQSLVVHPRAAIMPKEHWLVVRWNAAWSAASAADGVVVRSLP